jgi:thiamine biosynthesis lipoprotein
MALILHSRAMKAPTLEKRDATWVGRFDAMASPCELIMEIEDQILAGEMLAAVAAEAGRIERKFSRYLAGNPIDTINGSEGRPVEVDDETADLLDFAERCHGLSQGRFDVTAGVLRRLWRFDGSDRVPSRRQVKELLPLIGWDRLSWRRPWITLVPGMEIDLGGIGKEYAVDRAQGLIAGRTESPCLINFGGDLRVTAPSRSGRPWRVAIEGPESADPQRRIEVRGGALATSGDSKRYLLKNGVRYPHVLNPRTGWPVMHAPRSVTVAAASCSEAGMFATFAMLKGKEAEAFLAEQGLEFWCRR